MVKSAALPALSASQPPQSLAEKLILIQQVWFGPSGPAAGRRPTRQAAQSLPCGGETLGELGRKRHPQSQRVLTLYWWAESGRGVGSGTADAGILFVSLGAPQEMARPKVLGHPNQPEERYSVPVTSGSQRRSAPR